MMTSGSRSETARDTAPVNASSNPDIMEGVRSRYLVDSYGIISDIPTTGNGRALISGFSALHGAARRKKDRIAGCSLGKVHDIIRKDAADNGLSVTHAVKCLDELRHVCAASGGMRLLCCYA